jgi:hypothetical protein
MDILDRKYAKTVPMFMFNLQIVQPPFHISEYFDTTPFRDRDRDRDRDRKSRL